VAGRAHSSAVRSEACEGCHPDDAEIPFDWILAQVTGKRGSYEFILTDVARCPNCKHRVTEKTQVEPKLTFHAAVYLASRPLARSCY